VLKFRRKEGGARGAEKHQDFMEFQTVAKGKLLLLGGSRWQNMGNSEELLLIPHCFIRYEPRNWLILLKFTEDLPIRDLLAAWILLQACCKPPGLILTSKS